MPRAPNCICGQCVECHNRVRVHLRRYALTHDGRTPPEMQFGEWSRRRLERLRQQWRSLPPKP